MVGSVVLLCATSLAAQKPAPSEWRTIPLESAVRTGSTTEGRLKELSGAAASRAYPGVILSINDSGDPADLIAIDSTGKVLAIFHLTGVENVDWEEIALGPCGSRSCLYIGDIGDNLDWHKESTLYRIAEPVMTVAAMATVDRGKLGGAETLRFRYPDRAHNAEAMAVLPSGDVMIVTKDRDHAPFVFRIRSTAWQGLVYANAVFVDSLPIRVNPGRGEMVTGMAISPDASRAAVRTYRTIYMFALGEDGLLRMTPKPLACDVLGLEPQGEGITFVTNDRLLLTSEWGLFSRGSVWMGTCEGK